MYHEVTCADEAEAVYAWEYNSLGSTADNFTQAARCGEQNYYGCLNTRGCCVALREAFDVYAYLLAILAIVVVATAATAARNLGGSRELLAQPLAQPFSDTAPHGAVIALRGSSSAFFGGCGCT